MDWVQLIELEEASPTSSTTSSSVWSRLGPQVEPGVTGDGLGGTGHGSSRMSPRRTVLAGRKDRVLQALTALVNTLVGGGVAPQAAPYFCGARLHAAAKKDGGIRPIAVGNLLRRLVSKCCTTRLQGRAAALFAPHQLGVGVRGGGEAIIHTVRKILAYDPPSSSARLTT